MISVVVGDLAAEQLVQLNLVGSSNHLAVAEVDFELRGRDFGVVLLVLEAHGALHFGRGVDELAQRIERQRVIVAASGDEIEFTGFVICLFSILAGEEETFDFGRGVERVLLFSVEFIGVILQHSAEIAGVKCAVLIDDDAEDEDFAVAEDVGGDPVKGAPVDAETEVAFLLRGEAADGRAVEGEVFVGAQEELLVVVEQVEAALKVREQYRHGLDALFVGEVFEAFLADLVAGNTADAVMLGLQVKFFQLLVREGKEIAVISRHGSPSGEMCSEMDTVYA